VFELPVIIFFLTLLRILSPRWLMANTRYAILAIVVIAAVVTPTPAYQSDAVCSADVRALISWRLSSYMLVLQREGGNSMEQVAWWTLWVLVLAAGAVYVAIRFYHFHLIRHWPFPDQVGPWRRRLRPSRIAARNFKHR